MPGYQNLKSIKGLGDIGSSTLLSTLGDMNDFASEGKLAAYLGIVPRVTNSNEMARSGRITKRGNKLGRTALVQCALIAMRYSPYLAHYYARIKAARGTGEAIIARARKFLGIIYRTLKNGWVFEDFPRFVIAPSGAQGGGVAPLPPGFIALGPTGGTEQKGRAKSPALRMAACVGARVTPQRGPIPRTDH